MIIKAKPHDNAGNLARYLLRTKENETEFMLELRDAASDDLRKALTDWEAIGRSKTKGSQILYHAHIRLRQGEVLHEAQWFKVIEDLEGKLGFTNCPRAIIGHNSADKGLHVHVAWSRMDPVKNRLVPLGNDRKHHHSVARAAEKEFGLEPVTPIREKAPRNRRLSSREVRAMKDRGINQDKLTKIVRAAWDATDSGEEMRAMLGALGVEMQPGERRDWVVVYKGLKVNPVRLLEGVRAAEFRTRMQDVDLAEETERTREKPPAEAMHSRTAGSTIQSQIARSIANDEPVQTPKAGFTKRKHKAPQPRFRKKMWYGDPGI